MTEPAAAASQLGRTFSFGTLPPAGLPNRVPSSTIKIARPITCVTVAALMGRDKTALLGVGRCHIGESTFVSAMIKIN
jgi:hypothetical protein